MNMLPSQPLPSLPLLSPHKVDKQYPCDLKVLGVFDSLGMPTLTYPDDCGSEFKLNSKPPAIVSHRKLLWKRKECKCLFSVHPSFLYPFFAPQ